MDNQNTAASETRESGNEMGVMAEEPQAISNQFGLALHLASTIQLNRPFSHDHQLSSSPRYGSQTCKTAHTNQMKIVPEKERKRREEMRE